MERHMGETDHPECNCKVGRVLDRWGRNDLAVELGRRWAAGDESLRELAQTTNVAILRGAIERQGPDRLDGEVQNLYRLLTDDEVTSGTRMEARNRLNRDGVDVDAIEDDFVSHQTVHSHLTECLEVNRESRSDDPSEAARRHVRSLQSRMEAVTEDAVTRVGDGDYDAMIDVIVTCKACGTRLEFGEFLESDGCGCRK